jgi:hypothetical protein
VGRQDSSSDPRLAGRQDSSSDPRLAGRQDSSSDPRLAGRQDSSRDPRLAGRQDSSSDPRLAGRQDSSSDPRLAGRQDSSSDPRLAGRQDSIPGRDSPVGVSKAVDPRISRLQQEGGGGAVRGSGAGPGSDRGGGGETGSPPPGVSRQTSQPVTAGETMNARAAAATGSSDQTQKTKKVIDYRNDPRFRRKKLTTPAGDSSPTTSSSPSHPSPPPVVPTIKKYNSQRKGTMEYSSPLGGDGAGKQDGASSYNSYNRPPPNMNKANSGSAGAGPNVNNTRLGSGSSSSSKNDGASVGVHSHVAPDLASRRSPGLSEPCSDALVPGAVSVDNMMLPPSLQVPPPPDVHLKDLFKTFDPTASPFM